LLKLPINPEWSPISADWLPINPDWLPNRLWWLPGAYPTWVLLGMSGLAAAYKVFCGRL